MKVAIIFSGYTGNTDVFKNNKHFNDFILRYNPDCYFSIWDKEIGDLSMFSKVICDKSTRPELSKVIDINKEDYDKTQHIFEIDKEEYKRLRSSKDHVFLHTYPENLLYNLRSQYYHVQKSFNLIKKDYDVIIRLRSFVNFKKEFIIEDYKYFIDNDIPICFSDWIVMGNKKVMSIYSNLYDSLYTNLEYPYSSFVEMYPMLYFAQQGLPSYVDNSNNLPFEIKKVNLG
jgi:hypothetical protein